MASGRPGLRQFSGQVEGDLRRMLALDFYDEILMRIASCDADGAAYLLARDIRDGHDFLM